MLSKRRDGAFGRKSQAYKWDELQTTLTGAGADMTNLVGVKLIMPACWDAIQVVSIISSSPASPLLSEEPRCCFLGPLKALKEYFPC
jgi:hypothetical protein